MSDYLTPKAREHFERASAKGCVCGLCELIAALPEIIRKIKARAWDECSQSLFYEDGEPVEVLGNNNPYKEEA